ncbi:Hsp70 family protein [Candidatus Uabimicrobium amorphum]|uniref:Chaperone protein dnaK3 n=1 Tax=Uabimicrobium amorphum TaxID=2596890 RepID=A0A5S9F718_UABAM|nr:Hsp70 family protein [Candidatus Uabimicrobium amorphum]BBM87249.1 chaperone protein dnaK3 [Candidatus Uabimicrobium amorphum]
MQKIQYLPTTKNTLLLQRRLLRRLYGGLRSSLRQEVSRLTQLATQQNFANDVELRNWIAQNALQTARRSTANNWPIRLPKWPDFSCDAQQRTAFSGVSLGNSSCVVVHAQKHSQVAYKTDIHHNSKWLTQVKEQLNGKSIVIAVPAHFNDNKRRAVRDMFSEFNVARVINEPTAIVLAHGIEDRRVLVVDLGAKNLDMNVIDIEDGICEICDSVRFSLGSRQFDVAIAQWLAQQIDQKHNVSTLNDPQCMNKLQLLAEAAKKTLSYKNKARIQCDHFVCVDKIIAIDVVISRQVFADLIRGYCREIQEKILPFLPRVSQIILAGGGMYTSCITDSIREIAHKRVLLPTKPDEVIAMGCAIQGGVLCGFSHEAMLQPTPPFSPPYINKQCIQPRTIDTQNMYVSPKKPLQGVLLLDVTPLSLNVEIGNSLHTILPRNTAIPVRKVYNVCPRRNKIIIHVTCGERDVGNNRVLKTIHLTNCRRKPVEISVEIDVNGHTIIAVVNGKHIQKYIVDNKSELPTDHEGDIRDKDTTQPLENIPTFEKYLSDEAGVPGPIERIVAQSRHMLKMCQHLFGLYFIAIAHAIDIFVETVTSYISGVYYTWKLYTSVERRLSAQNVTQQRQMVMENFTKVRGQLARVFRFKGAHIDDDYSPTFPLEIVVETRYLLDQMKRDLSLLTYQQSIQLAKSQFKDVIKSYVPNPLEFLNRCKDCLLMLFYMKYTRRDIETMYMEFVKSYCNILQLLSEECGESYVDVLLPYERIILHEIHSDYISQPFSDIEKAIDETRKKLQRLMHVLFCAQRFANPRYWRRVDLLRELNVMAHPVYFVEWEQWLSKEVRKIWRQKKRNVSSREKSLRDIENRQRNKDLLSAKHLVHTCF